MKQKPISLSSDVADASYDPTPSDWHNTLLAILKGVLAITSLVLSAYFLYGILSK
ncbi:MAG: hypothetical protein HOD27_03005 [Betaproteobacteria bacterium]|jgi:hypothetical protein|nr:hypothetical protein [Betaproteobacteria bacterium]